MSIRSSLHYPAETGTASKFICSPLGSAVPGQCHCSPAMNCSCGPSNPNDPLMYFRYSDCNVVEEYSDAEDEDCRCQPCRGQSPMYSNTTSRQRCHPKRPIHMQMSCSGSPTAAEWKRFHSLKRQWAREKNRKKAQHSVCSTSCQLTQPLLQKHGAADEACARALGIPSCVGSGARPILDPDSWRVSKVMTSAATFCSRCCTDGNPAVSPVNLDVNFGVQYCGPAIATTETLPPPLPYNGDAGSYDAASQRTRFDVPYRPSEDLRSLVRRPTPFPSAEMDLIGNAERNSLLGSAGGPYPGNLSYAGAGQSLMGSNVVGELRPPSTLLPYEITGQQASFYGSPTYGSILSGQSARNGSLAPKSVYSRPGSGTFRSERTRFDSQTGSALPNALRSYRESELADVVPSGESSSSSDPSYSGGSPYENDGLSRREQEGSMYSRAVPSVAASRRTHKSHMSRADGRSVKSRGDYTINTEGGRSVYTTRTNAKSHHSRKTLQEDPTFATYAMEGEPSTHTTRTTAKSHRSQRTLNQAPSNKSRIDARSHVSHKTYQEEPSFFMDGEPSTFTIRTNAKSHRSQRTLNQSPSKKSRIDARSHVSHKTYQEEPSVFMDGEPSTFTIRTNAKSHRSQRTLNQAPSKKSRIDARSHVSRKTYQEEPSVFVDGEPSTFTTRTNAKSHRSQKTLKEDLTDSSTDEEPSAFTTRTNAKSHHSQRTLKVAPSMKSRIDTKSQRFPQPVDNELKKKPLGKSCVSFHHTVKKGAKSQKSKMLKADKSHKSVASKKGKNFTDTETDDSSDEGDATVRPSPSSVVTVIKLSDHLRTADLDSPISQANKSRKSRK